MLGPTGTQWSELSKNLIALRGERDMDEVIKSPEGQKLLEEFREKVKVENQRLEDFYASARFQEIITYIVQNDAAINAADLAYSPENHPTVTSEEFLDFCEIIFDKHKGDLRATSINGPHSTVELKIMGMKITRFMGQGRTFTVQKDAAPAVQPAPTF